MAPVTEPFPISYIADRYLLFDVDAISHARREHNICGVLVGTMPQFSQQNVFLGIPLELMPEEARVLVEQGHGYIVDDVKVHQEGFMQMSREQRLAFIQTMDQRGHELALNAKRKAEDRTTRALKEKGLVAAGTETPKSTPDHASFGTVTDSLVEEPTTVVAPVKKLERQYLTPPTSYPPLAKPAIDSSLLLPKVPKSYPLFRYMQSKGYFSMPGLRFGCHYNVYPGDPLRFHSHFVATGLGFDEDFDLLDIIGGGRLGTGVKKAYLIGGEDPTAKDEGVEPNDAMKVFSIEWAGF